MGQNRGRAVFLAMLGLVAVSVGAVLGRVQTQPSTATVTGQETHAHTPTPGIRVHVSGMVVNPGVVDVTDGAIVADAIDAAGGLKPGALVDQINLAAPVTAGDQIIVPGRAEGPTLGGTAGVDGVISLNQADAADLETLPGVGPVLAERIVAFRETSGPFETVEDLLDVPGIGEAKLEALRDLVRP